MAINYTGQGGAIANESMPFTNATFKTRSWTDTGNKTIPAGAYKVKIYSQSVNDPITVNGETVSPDQELVIEHQLDEVNKKQDLCPEIIIVAAGSDEIDYTVYYPSNSIVDPNNI